MISCVCIVCTRCSVYKMNYISLRGMNRVKIGKLSFQGGSEIVEDEKRGGGGRNCFCEISSFRCDEVGAFVLLGWYAAHVGSCLPTFRDNLSGHIFDGKAIHEQCRATCGFVII
jgi:hypothetical protein